MGEAKQKSRSKKQILRENPRCVYCLSLATTVEHMPPKAMFQKDRFRPSGMEFGCCEACNNGTKAADAIASFLAYLSPTDSRLNEWQMPVLVKLRDTAEQLQPGFRAEFFNQEKASRTFPKNTFGFLMPATKVIADGPIIKRNMTSFSAKLGMALYQEHVGEPLPEGSGVFVKWFLNAGLSEEQSLRYLRILPVRGELRMGAKTSIDQFGYRYNCDDRSILAAMIGFHSNLHIFVIATSDLATFGDALSQHKELTFVKFGELTNLLSTKT